MMRTWIVVALAAVAVGGCDDGTGPAGMAEARVDVAFAASSGTPVSSLQAFGSAPIARSVQVNGPNGVLVIDTIQAILAEFELKSALSDDDCEAVGLGDDCHDFDAPPALVELPLNGGVVTVASSDVQGGPYERLEFEIEDLEDDEDDGVTAQRIAELRAEILARFPDWPLEASLRMVGTFTPAGGSPVPFQVFAEAEIEVEMEFASPLVVDSDDVSRTVTVEIAPANWFTRGDGTVIDLSAFDYGSTGLVPEFEVEIENGFGSIEHDDDGDSDHVEDGSGDA